MNQKSKYNAAYAQQYHTLVKQLENSHEKGTFMPTIIEQGSSVMTIGYGHQCTVEEAKQFRNGITTQQADQLYNQDYADSVNKTRTIYNSNFATGQNADPFGQLPQGPQLLMTEITFNLGFNGLKQYVKLMKFVSERQFYKAVDENGRGCRQDASLIKGLGNRTQRLQSYFKQYYDSEGYPK